MVNFGKVTNSSIYFSEVMKAGGLDVGDPVEQQVLLRVAVWKTCEHSDTVQTAFLIDEWLMLGSELVALFVWKGALTVI